MKEFIVYLLVDSPAGKATHELAEGVSEPPEIRETDTISFTVVSKHSMGEPTLFVQDHPVALTSYQKGDESVEYRAELKRHLLNHFGLASVALFFDATAQIFRVTPINVVATKINKEQAEKILGYLSLKMADVTKICFSKTQAGSDSQPGDNVDTLTKLNFSRKILEAINSSRTRFMTQPCKRSSEQLRITPYDDGAHITDREIDWLFKHLDQLYPVPIDSSKVSIQNRHYSIDKIQRAVVEKNTNLFENQVIYGFLINLKKFLLDIPDHLKSYKPNSKHTGFYTFDSILQTIEAPLLQRRHREAVQLVRQCNDLISFFEKYLPCQNKGVLRPVLTPLAKRYTHYDKTFRLIDEWYRLGQPKWSGANYLFGMKSLDKLYEFFCLYKLIDCLRDAGFTLTAAQTRSAARELGTAGRLEVFSDDDLSNYYTFTSGDKKVQLFYEPTIWSHSKYSQPNELVDVFHAGTGYRSCWTPDFLIKTEKEGVESYLIFDAKYSDHSNTKDKHLPDIISKYYLKTRSLSKQGVVEGPGAIKAVYAFIPKSFNDEYGMYGGAFNLGDRLACAPYFGYVKLSSDEERGFNSFVKQIIRAA
jgi:hypothetical protein